MKKAAKELQKHLMTATSYMIPFVVAGGILYSLSILLGGEGAVPTSGWLAQLNQIGAAGLALFIPVLGGYIAFSIADNRDLHLDLLQHIWQERSEQDLLEES